MRVMTRKEVEHGNLKLVVSESKDEIIKAVDVQQKLLTMIHEQS